MKWIDLLIRWVEGWAQGALWSVLQQLEQLRWRLFESLLLVMLAAACGWAVLLLGAALVLLTYWDTHRWEALWGLLLVYAGMGIWMVRRAGRLVTFVSSRSSRHSAFRSASCARSPRAGGACHGEP